MVSGTDVVAALVLIVLVASDVVADAVLVKEDVVLIVGRLLQSTGVQLEQQLQVSGSVLPEVLAALVPPVSPEVAAAVVHVVDVNGVVLSSG